VVEDIEQTEDGETYVTAAVESDREKAFRDTLPEFVSIMSQEGVRRLDHGGELETDAIIVYGRTQADNYQLGRTFRELNIPAAWFAREGHWAVMGDDETLDELTLRLPDEFEERGIDAKIEYVKDADDEKYEGYYADGGRVNNGDVVRIKNPMPDENPDQLYLVVQEHLDEYGPDDQIEVMALGTGMSIPGVNRVEMRDLEVVENAEKIENGGEVGDLANVIAENKSGVVMRVNNGKFHMKFPDGTERTYSAEELKFINSDDDFEQKLRGGGKVKFKDKVASVKKSLLERKKVPKSVQKDYGKTYSPAEAQESAQRIVGAMTAAERIKMRIKSKKGKK
jgi:hypothetical protein